jgi:hypothetical protein
MTQESKWEPAISVIDVRVAHSVAKLLEAEMISVQVMPESQITGTSPSWTVLVPAGQSEAAAVACAISVHGRRAHLSCDW